MPSPSVALLSALIAGKERPKRLLVSKETPAFIPNIGRVAGAIAVTVAPADIDEVLGLLRTEGLSPDRVWALATHRGGTLASTDWLSRCAASGVPTVELCLGSFTALARRGRSPATFTIVELDAEEIFAGAHLTALLTSDPGMAARVQELCLPSPEAQDYIIDAWPRGLAHDEPALATLLEGAMARGGEKLQGARDTPALTPPGVGAFQSAVLSENQKKLDAQQRTIDEWEARFAETESEAAADAAILSNLRADLLRQRSESERALASMRAEKEALAQKLMRAERERHLAVVDAAHRDESERGIRRELRQRVEQFEKNAAASADREARQAKASEASHALLSARVVQLEADAAVSGKAHANLLDQKAKAEQALAAIEAEKRTLTGRLANLDAELDEALADAAQRTAAHQVALDEQSQRAARLEREVMTLSSREATQARHLETLRTQWSERIAGLEAENEALGDRLSSFEKDRDRALADAARREEAQRLATWEQMQRADQREREATALTESAARQAREGEALRVDLVERIARLEADSARAEKARGELLAQKEEAERGLALLQSETDALGRRLAAAESARDLARTDAEKRAATLRAALEEQKKRLEKSEKDTAVLTVREASQAQAWEARRVEMSKRITQLEESAVAAERAHADLVRDQAAKAERAVASIRAEREALARKLAEAEKDRDRAFADAARREETQGLATEEQRQRADQLEREATALTESAARQAREGEALRVDLVDRIARLEADSARAEKAKGELQAQKEEAERGLALLQSEQDERGRRLAAVESARDLARADAEKRDATLRAALEEQKKRLDQSKKDTAAFAAREASQAQAWEARRVEMSERIAQLEAAAAAAERAHADLVRDQAAEAERAVASIRGEREALARKLAEVEKDRDRAFADAARREETQGLATEEQRRRADQLERDIAARAERETRQANEWTRLWAQQSERLARVEADLALAEKARGELEAQKEEAERGLALVQSEEDLLGRRLAAAESARDLARADAERRGASLRDALEEHKKRLEQAESYTATLNVSEVRKAHAWEAKRVEMSERIAQLEESAVAAERAHADLVRDQAAEAERAVASLRAEGEALARKLAVVEEDRDRARADAARREETQRAVLEQQRQRADQLERDIAARAERETRQADEWTRLWAQQSERLARMEASAAENEQTDLARDHAAEAERAVASIRAEGEALARKLAEVEKDRDRVRSDAARREETQLAVIEEQRQRADQLERDIAARTEHEARLTDEWTLLRAQQSERIALLEASAIAAENAQSDLLAQRSDAERALALMQAERDRLVTRLAEIARDRDLAPAAAAGGEQGPSAEPLKTEAAAPAEAAAEGDGRPVEAWEASRAELMARIAQLEAQEVISDKARTELLNRKRDSDQALAAAQAERAVLLKKLAVAEHDRDPARAVAESFEEDRKEPETRSVPTAPAGAQGVSGRHDTGGLSALVSRWDTGVTRRPFRSKVVEQKSPDPPVDEGSEPEVIATESAASSGAAPAPERERQPKPDRPAPGGPARPNPPRRPAPKPAPASDKANQSGGWLQGLTTRILRKP